MAIQGSTNAYSELFNYRGIPLNSGRWSYRSPLVCHFFDKRARKEFLFVLNHLARGKPAMRQQQAKGLREWARGQTLPIICSGDFNFDWDFHTKKGNTAFRLFTQDDVWTWAKPAQLVDTNWAARIGLAAPDAVCHVRTSGIVDARLAQQANVNSYPSSWRILAPLPLAA